MDLQWVREESPRWDQHKRSVFGVDGPHVFGLGRRETVRYSPTNGWRADDEGEDEGETVGSVPYGVTPKSSSSSRRVGAAPASPHS
jgi:hypothetical protein